MRKKHDSSIKRVTPLIDKILELLIQGKTEDEALKAHGQQRRYLAKMFKSPVIRREYEKRVEEVRTGARARNILAAIKVRDVVLGDQPFTAAQSTAALKAAEWLHGEPSGSPSGGLNVNVVVNPGYVIRLPARRDDAQPLSQRQVIEHKPLKSLNVITDEQR